MTGTDAPPTAIRVPAEGLAWLAETCARGGAPFGPASGGMLIPAGVSFDSLETPCATGRYAMRWLLENRRPIGPVALDSRADRTRFLIPPGTGVIVPDVVAELAGAGRSVRLPGRATTGDALFRWLIVPRSRPPRLTDPADLLAAITAYHGSAARRRSAGPPQPAPGIRRRTRVTRPLPNGRPVSPLRGGHPQGEYGDAVL
jgi:hypothetical protein